MNSYRLYKFYLHLKLKNLALLPANILTPNVNTLFIHTQIHHARWTTVIFIIFILAGRMPGLNLNVKIWRFPVRIINIDFRFPTKCLICRYNISKLSKLKNLNYFVFLTAINTKNVLDLSIRELWIETFQWYLIEI